VTLRDHLLLAAAVLALAGCGDDAPTDVDSGVVECTTPLAQRYLPLVVGATWTYDTSDMGSPIVPKTTTFEAYEDVGDRKTGILAFRQRTEKVAGVAVSWHSDDCTAVTRHREQTLDGAGTLVSDQFYVPGKLRVDESGECSARPGRRRTPRSRSIRWSAPRRPRRTRPGSSRASTRR
jgi:hypothetical protein